MKQTVWTEIEESAGFQKLPIGGYVMRVIDAKDKTNANGKAYLEVVYDVNEGDYRDFYRDEEDWRHSVRVFYEGKSAGFFKAFLNRLEESNKGFEIERWQRNCDERDLRGLLIGIVMQKEMWTNEKGEDKEAIVATDPFYSIFDIRAGDFKIPEPNDRRKKVAKADEQDAFDDDYQSPF